MNGKTPYDDIINLPHHVSEKRPQMARQDRAAQFAPFAALTGFGAAISETSRLTEEKPELDEYDKKIINDRLNTLIQRVKEEPVATFIYFQPDKEKSGGAYITVTDTVTKIDIYKRSIHLQSGLILSIDDVVGVEE